MSTSSITSASDIQTDYMKLLVAQLQNQNPLEPLSNNEMASQLAQFSQLEQLESMKTSFDKVLATTELSYAASLLGKEVSFLEKSDTSSAVLASGIVEQVYNNLDGQIILSVGSTNITIDDVISITS